MEVIPKEMGLGEMSKVLIFFFCFFAPDLTSPSFQEQTLNSISSSMHSVLLTTILMQSQVDYLGWFNQGDSWDFGMLDY